MMRTVKRTSTYNTTPDRVFQCLDNLGVTGMHMTQSSMMMMGNKLDLQFLTDNRTGLGTKYRWTGKMMGMKMDFTVEVTKWINGKEKVWETIGHSELIIYSWYRMHLQLTKMPNGTKAQLSISYRLPEGIFYKIISFLLADWYCRWCLRNMLADAKKILLRNSERHLMESKIRTL